MDVDFGFETKEKDKEFMQLEENNHCC